MLNSISKFEKDCFYKYRGGDIKGAIENIVYKCVYAGEETATLELKRVFGNTRLESYLLPVQQDKIIYFTKSGVQEDKWVAKNGRIFDKIEDKARKEKLIKDSQITVLPHNVEKKGYIAYPDIPEDEAIVFNDTVDYPKINDCKIQVDNPSHYNQGNIEPIDYIEANKLGFCEGNVVKYITRHKYKNGKEDILKAIKYCEYILKYQYGNKD